MPAPESTMPSANPVPEINSGDELVQLKLKIAHQDDLLTRLLGVAKNAMTDDSTDDTKDDTDGVKPMIVFDGSIPDDETRGNISVKEGSVA